MRKYNPIEIIPYALLPFGIWKVIEIIWYLLMNSPVKR